MKIKRLIAGLLMTSVSFSVFAAEPLLNEKFSAGKASVSLSGNGRIVEEGKNNHVMSLPGRSYLVFPKLEVQYDTKYCFSFRGRYESADAIETNAEKVKELFFLQSRKEQGLYLPTWELRFFNADGKQVKTHIFYPYFRCVYSSKWQPYRDVFYPAPDAKYVQLIFQNTENNGTLYLDDFKLEPVKEDALNVNPEFSYGDYNYSGYSMSGWESKVRMESDKTKTVMNVPTWIDTDPIPVSGETQYRVDCSLVANPSKSAELRILCSDPEMNFQQTATLRPDGKKLSGSFSTPAGCRYIKVRISGKGASFSSLKVKER